MRERQQWALLAVGTAAGTVVLAALRLPSPALFAGLVVATGLALAGHAPAAVPRRATTLAQAVIGVVIGVLARPDTLTGLAAHWLPVLLITVGTLAVSMAAGLLLGLHPGITPLTGMLALTAGGASGLVAVSRDLGGDDRVVAVVQPAGGLLGPMTVAIALTVSGLWPAAPPPDVVVELAYAVIGWQAGVRFTRTSLRTVVTVLPLACVLIVAIIAACAGLGLLLSAATGATVLEGYLATTPGGVYAVLATAISAGGNVTFVVATQVLRVIVMLLVAPALARLVRRRAA